MGLREAIKEKHDRAEEHRFVKLLLSGEMPKEIYGEYLVNQFFCYAALEDKAFTHGLFEGIESIARSNKIAEDIKDIAVKGIIHPSTSEYALYIHTVQPNLLWAHIYARHFADMYGGQMIKKVAPGSGHMYEFENRAELIEKVRAKLTDDLAGEANRVFDYALRLFDEISDAHNI